MKAGDKISNKVTIPGWIIENEKYSKACIRGLIDTDGCVYELKPHWPGLIQISYKCYNKTMLEDVRKIFLNLGFTVSKISNNCVYITRKDQIAKFVNEINFNNSKHRIRYTKIIAPSSSGQRLSADAANVH
ncbi:MAG: LAGLIDADG family homing endonuclease [Candidatus Omnitrophica bacterium]|nr:LAGLIDADG family homing endonuclease [Candidatus Omnitrophota bacterium]